MKTYIKTFILALAVLLSQGLMAQTFHGIVFCNTIDESIGESMKVDMQNMSDKIQTLQTLLEEDYNCDFKVFDGDGCTRANLKSYIDGMEVGSDDVIFTFYGGNGSHAENNASDPWPQYLMNSGFENQSNWIPMAEFAKWIKSKGARLSIITSNCCNKEQSGTTIKPLWVDDGRATKLDNLDAEKFRTLFAAKGVVMATSSKLGQYSWCNGYGGLFTCDFIDVLNMVGKGQIAPDWEAVLKKAYEMCSAREIRTREYPYTAVQNPYYKVSVNGGSSKRKHNEDDTDKPSTTLIDALGKITDRSISEDARIDMINGIVSKYFDSAATVITVGNDMETQFAEEPVRDFLRRICLSPSIKGVNILNESRTLLRVHEIR